MTAQLKSEVFSLSPAERILLVEEIWDSLAADPANIPVTPEQLRELEARLEEYKRNPDAGSDWETVLARVRNSK